MLIRIVITKKVDLQITISMLEEKDIDFSRLNWKRFEELCFDLLMKYHFHTLIWREGGGDSGRDIEGYFEHINPLIGKFREKWLVECKHHNKGINLRVISEKIEWAKAEKPDHFLLITSSHLTAATRNWIDKKRSECLFRIHVIEGKILKQRLLAFPELISNYFADDETQLVKSMLRQWAFHDILPEPSALYKVFTKVNFNYLGNSELAFLWYAQRRQDEGMQSFWRNENLQPISDHILLPFLRHAANATYPIQPPEFLESHKPPLGTLYFNDEEELYRWASVHESYESGERIQVVLEANKKNLSVFVAAQKNNDS